jgi:hypothetical protein
VHDVGERDARFDIELIFDRASDHFDASGAITEFEDARTYGVKSVQLAAIDHHNQRFAGNDARGCALGLPGH